MLDAGFFEELVTELPSVERCDVLMKADGHDNEMTWFRRDVVLRVGPDPRPEVAAERIAWVPGHDGEAIGSLLASTAADAVVVDDVADRRLAPLLDVLDAGAHRDTSAGPRPAVRGGPRRDGGVEPDRARRRRCHVRVAGRVRTVPRTAGDLRRRVRAERPPVRPDRPAAAPASSWSGCERPDPRRGGGTAPARGAQRSWPGSPTT